MDSWRNVVVLIVAAVSIFGCDSSLADGQQTLTLIKNSRAICRVIDVNSVGDVIGEREVISKSGIIESHPFFYDVERQYRIPVPADYTSVRIFRVNHAGWIVGFASRAAGNSDGNTVACLWNPKEDELIVLPKVAGLIASVAFDISENGRWVSGYTTGREPPRMLPCLWERVGDDWNVSTLNVKLDFNPFLTSSKVVISDDGLKVAASLATEKVGLLPGANQLFLWERDEDGWQRKQIFHRGIVLGNVNNRGTVVGYEARGGKRHPVIVHADKTHHLLKLLPGDDSAVATDINNQGRAIGYGDGRDGGSHAFSWWDGKLEPIAFPIEPQFSTATSITDDGTIAGMYTSHGSDDQAEAVFGFVLRRFEDAATTK